MAPTMGTEGAEEAAPPFSIARTSHRAGTHEQEGLGLLQAVMTKTPSAPLVMTAYRRTPLQRLLSRLPMRELGHEKGYR